MRIAVFGGTGRTGRLFVEQALAAGHEVTVLARTPSKLEVKNESLRIAQGDALDPDRVKEVVSGADAIVSLLGPAKDAPPQSVSRSMANILRAAEECGVKRIVISAGAGVGDPQDKPGLFDKVIKTALMLTARDAYEDMKATVDAVQKSRLNWTVARAPMLTDDPAKGQPRVGYLGQGVGARLSRADLAAFMLAQLTDKTYVGKAPVISN